MTMLGPTFAPLPQKAVSSRTSNNIIMPCSIVHCCSFDAIITLRGMPEVGALVEKRRLMCYNGRVMKLPHRRSFPSLLNIWICSCHERSTYGQDHWLATLLLAPFCYSNFIFYCGGGVIGYFMPTRGVYRMCKVMC